MGIDLIEGCLPRVIIPSVVMAMIVLVGVVCRYMYSRLCTDISSASINKNGMYIYIYINPTK